MALNWKRIALLIAFIAAVILFGYLLYYFFLKPTIPSGPVGVINNAGTGALPSAGGNVNIPVAGNINGALPGQAVSTTSALVVPILTQPGASPVANGGNTQVRPLTTLAAAGMTISSDGGSAIYYDQATAHFYRVSPGGTPVLFSNQAFYDVSSITWAPNKQLAVLKYPDNSTIVYDFSKNKQITLPSHWKDFSFSPDSSKLVFKSMGVDTQNRWLAVTSVDGTQAKKIESLGDKDATVQPSWSPNNQVIAMFEEGQNFNQQNVYFVGQNNENFKSMTIDGRGLESQWSTTGDKLLYSVYSSDSNYKPTLWIADAQGDSIGNNRHNLQIETWSDKCTFADNTTIFCAVPRSLDNGAGLFSDQLNNSPTDIYRVDLTSGLRTKLATPAVDVNAENLQLSGNGTTLYFTDHTTGLLYSMALK